MDFHGKKRMLTAMLAVGLFMISIIAVIPSGVDAADSEFSITDGKGNTVKFTGPVDHIITIGKGVTLNAIQLGYVDKIVVADKYSATDSSELFDGLRANIEKKVTTAGGTIYSAGIDTLKSEIIDAVDKGKFDKTKDVIILTGGESYIEKNGLRSYLMNDLGLRVLAWNDVKDYDGMVDLAEKMSMVLSGEKLPIVKEMSSVKDTVTKKLADNGITDDKKVKAFYVTYSADTFKVGNAGSVTTAMIQAAGGNAVTIDTTKSGTTYAANITELIEKYGKDTIIFADNTVAGSEKYMSDLRTQAGDGIEIIKLNAIWNNYAIESMEGVKMMASTMYPEIFTSWDSGESASSGDGNNMALYIAVAVIACVAVAIVAVFMMKRK